MFGDLRFKFWYLISAKFNYFKLNVITRAVSVVDEC